MWSQGSSGVSSWLFNEARGSFVVSYANGRVSLTEEVGLSYSDDISKIINEHNDEWWIWYNCSHFAIDIWNAVSEDDFDKNFIQTPDNLKNKISEREGYQINRNITGEREKVGYYTNDLGFVNSVK